MAAAGRFPSDAAASSMVAWSSPWLLVLGAPGDRDRAGPGPSRRRRHRPPGGVRRPVPHAPVGGKPIRTEAFGVKLALLAPLTAIALAGSLAYHQSWPFLFFFLSVAVASALPENRAIFGIAAVTVVDAIVVTRPSVSRDQRRVRRSSVCSWPA